MLTYTICLMVVGVLLQFYGHDGSSRRDPLVYKIFEAVVTILLFAGNLLYAFAYVTPLVRTAWKFVFPLVVLVFVVGGYRGLDFSNSAHPLQPTPAVLGCIAMLALFFPSFRANFLIGYADVARVRAIDRPAIVSEDPLNDLLAEIKKLRRTSQAAWIVTVLLLAILIVVAVFQFRFEKPLGDSWEKVRRLAEASQYEEALIVANRLIAKDPDNPYTRALIGNLQMAAGNINQAEGSYARAYELLPNESNANMLTAIRKRIENPDQNPSPNP